MSLVLLVSIFIRVVATIWAVLLYRRIRDWRMVFLAAMLALMATRQVLTLSKALSAAGDWTISVGGHLTELPGLAVSALAALAVYFLDQILVERRQRAEVLAERERQLRQAQKLEAFSELAGGIAHDFNNMLTAIVGNAQLAAMSARGNAKALNHIRALEEAAHQASDLTGRILTFARRGEPRRVVVDPNQLIAELVPLVRQLIDGQGIEVVVLLDEGVGAIEVDPTELTRVVLNLASNAKDAMPSGGKLTLRLEAGEGLEGRQTARLSVSDTGTGISPDVQEHIFEPFFTTKTAGRGTGLGLSICYSIVAELGGTLEVWSGEEGTRFTVTLPTTDRRVASASRPEVEAPGGSETILVVEDEAQVLSLATQGLESLGYTVLSAMNGVDALSLLEGRQGEVDLVLSDVMMPQMGGNELAARLAEAHPGVPVILMSGFAVTASTPVSGFLSKPFRVTELAQAVRQALDGARNGEGRQDSPRTGKAITLEP